jgi:hypothetical protein
MESIECVENQNENENENQIGGNIIGIDNNSTSTIENKIYKITYYEKKLNKIYNLINISTIL